MDLMSNGFGFGNSSADKPDSITRYLGGNLGEVGFGKNSDDSFLAGMDFSSILKTQMNQSTSLDPKLNASLERLEAGQSLGNYSPDEMAKHIFTEIDKILLGVNQLMGNMSQLPVAMHENFEDLQRLIEGAKQLFDLHENPLVLEGLGQVWGDLKKKKSPVFHIVQNYFLHISIESATLSKAESQSLATASLENTAKLPKQSTYSCESFQLFYTVVNSFEPCDEKDDLLKIFDHSSMDASVEKYSNMLNFDSGESTNTTV
jgi:hypothetical protein